MKNISLVLNIVLAIAVAILFYLHFSSVATKKVAVADTVLSNTAGLKIAYVNSDSLLDKYEYYIKTKKELEAKEENDSKSLNAQAEALQKELEDAQAKVANMTAMQAQMTQENLQRKQQALMERRERLSEEFGKKMQSVNDDLTNKIHDYLKAYNKEHHFNYILGYQKGGGILYAQDELDITNEVLKGMNDTYKKGK
jgi:outer membrane protein